MTEVNNRTIFQVLRPYLIGVLVIAVVLAIVGISLAFYVRSFWRDYCGVSRLFDIHRMCARYEPGLDRLAASDSPERSWRVELIEWVNENSTDSQSGDVEIVIATWDNPFVCNPKYGMGCEFLGVFGEDGGWAYESEYDLPEPLRSILILEMPGLNSDWKQQGNLILRSDGTMVFRGADGRDVEVDPNGQRYITMDGDVGRL